VKQDQVTKMYQKGIELEYVPIMTGITQEQYLDQVRALHNPIIHDLFTERIRQNRQHPIFPPEMRFAVLVEEVGEVAQELQGPIDTARLKAELTQVAAVCLRWLEQL
jgi:hypothetical protein